jgi:hypothetical protein
MFYGEKIRWRWKRWRYYPIWRYGSGFADLYSYHWITDPAPDFRILLFSLETFKMPTKIRCFLTVFCLTEVHFHLSKDTKEVTKLRKDRFFLVGGPDSYKQLRIWIWIWEAKKLKDPELYFSPSIISCLPWLFHACIQVSERTRTNTQKILKLRPRCHAMDNIPEMHSHGKLNAESRQDCLGTELHECAWSALSLSALVQGAFGSGWAD